MENNLQKLKEVIWKANPSILELKFGCEVYCEQIVEDESGTLLDLHGTFVEMVGDESQILLAAEGCSGIWPYEKPESLGRPIRLADVLVAIDAKGKPAKWIHWGEVCMEWNMRADNLDHQSEECLKFLTELLC